MAGLAAAPVFVRQAAMRESQQLDSPDDASRSPPPDGARIRADALLQITTNLRIPVHYFARAVSFSSGGRKVIVRRPGPTGKTVPAGPCPTGAGRGCTASLRKDRLDGRSRRPAPIREVTDTPAPLSHCRREAEAGADSCPEQRRMTRRAGQGFYRAARISCTSFSNSFRSCPCSA